jgi:hypothetical protein
MILHEACLNIEGKKLILLRNEDHNSMNETTLLKYITPFMEKQYKLMNPNINLPNVKIPKELREQPETISKNNADNSTSGVLSSLVSLSKASTAATMSSIRKLSGNNNNETDENE